MLRKIRLKRFNDLTIGWKYGAILVIVFLLFGISTAIITTLNLQVKEGIETQDSTSDRAISATEMSSIIDSKGVRIVTYVQSPDEAVLAEYESYQEDFNLLAENLKKKVDNEQLQMVDQIIANDKQMNDLFLKEIVPYMQSGNRAMASSLSLKANDLRGETVSLLISLRDTLSKERNQVSNEVQSIQQLSFFVLIGSMLLSIAIGGLLVFLVSRKLSQNLNKVVIMSSGIANGDLNVDQISYEGNDEIGRMASAMNLMSNNLKNVIQQVSAISRTLMRQSEELTQSSTEVKAGSSQIAVTMESLASGSETQANSAGELSNAMEAFSSKMHESNQNGEYIYNSSNLVLQMTTEGTQLMQDSVKQMATIDQIVQEAVEKVKGLDVQSQKISQLVSVIKDIAEQTNLLALNAAIEAARAGEHGKGFAVVADEVRKLAEQVANSVKDITGIVNSIQGESTDVAESLQGGYKEVEKGTLQMETTGTTFANINNAVKDMVIKIQTVTDNLAIMSTNTESMSDSIEEIASLSEASAAGVEQTSASAQQASSSMDEIATNSDELTKLAEQLNSIVRQFNL
ncbi:methyl-accepting chemotaxis protein [Aquibacillus kalidii]|uniref:methyl-accepting chemotaxis protein n=1 Tax=Aquibacillus kalidii TaxID=2762597 RepID=UPI001647A89E|nr:HAMP domain-containing methyl-accepting chemotaxis protein [Aquibacillus kalidii]